MQSSTIVSSVKVYFIVGRPMPCQVFIPRSARECIYECVAHVGLIGRLVWSTKHPYCNWQTDVDHACASTIQLAWRPIECDMRNLAGVMSSWHSTSTGSQNPLSLKFEWHSKFSVTRNRVTLDLNYHPIWATSQIPLQRREYVCGAFDCNVT